MMWVLALIISTLVAAEPYQLRCSKPSDESSAFSSLTHPLRTVVSKFFHGSGCDASTLNFTSLEVSTWPSYLIHSATGSRKLRVAGFAYAVDTCRASHEYRRERLRKFFSLTGADRHLSESPNAAIPTEYVAHSVAGAEIIVHTANTAFTNYIQTNLYGHFDTTIELPSSVQIANNSVRLEVSGCDNPLNFNSKIPSIPKSVTIVPLIDNTGLTIVSDIDDVLKHSESWNLKRLCLYTYAQPFQPWLSMPQVFNTWLSSDSDIHFHYTTDAPEMSHQAYVDALQYYPLGTFDFRPMTLVNVTKSRFQNIERLIIASPNRRFILLGDDSTPGQLAAYADLAKRYRNEIKCVVLRRTSRRLDNVIDPDIKVLRGLKTLLFTSPKELPADANDLAERCDASSGLMVPDEDMNGWFASWFTTFRQLRWAHSGCFLLAPQRPDPNCLWDMRWGTRMWDGSRVRDETG